MNLNQLEQLIQTNSFHRKSTSFITPIINLMPSYVKKESSFITLEKGETLLYKGQKPSSVFIIVSGEMSVVNEFESGKVYEPVIVKHSNFSAVVEAILDYDEIIATNIANTKVELIQIPIKCFKQWLKESHKITTIVLQNVSRNFIKNMTLSGENVLLNSKYLFTAHLLNNALYDGNLYVMNETREKTAKRTGINLRTLYRYIKEFKNKGFIDVKGRKIFFTEQQRDQLHNYYQKLRQS